MIKNLLTPKTSIIYLFIALFFSSCGVNLYEPTTLEAEALFERKKFLENMNGYVYLVHTDDHVYTLKPSSLASDTLSGVITEVSDTAAIDEDKHIERRKVHLYVKDNTINESDIVLEPTAEISRPTVRLTKSDIMYTKVQARKKVGLLGILGLLGIIIVGLFVLTILLILILAGILAAGGSTGSTSNSDPSCYIATMVYGHPDTEQVLALRRFRDQHLLTNPYGQKFVKWYYANSPQFVERFKNNSLVNRAVRTVLNLLIKVIK